MDPISSPFLPQAEWTFEENKSFENALAEFDHVFPDLFEKIACRLPTKTINQIKEHYENLVHDIEMIEAGLVPLPNYEDNNVRNVSSDYVVGCTTNHQQQRKKPSPWLPEEHELFLEGLGKYGKGDWRSISRNCVRSKTPTQVASHAQKYFIRLERNMASTTTSRPKRNPTSNFEGASPSTMSSANLHTVSSPPFVSMDHLLATARLPSVSDFSTVEELDQLCAAYSSSYTNNEVAPENDTK